MCYTKENTILVYSLSKKLLQIGDYKFKNPLKSLIRIKRHNTKFVASLSDDSLVEFKVMKDVLYSVTIKSSLTKQTNSLALCTDDEKIVVCTQKGLKLAKFHFSSKRVTPKNLERVLFKGSSVLRA